MGITMDDAVMNREIIINRLKEIKLKYPDIKLGLAGSYVRGSQRKGSDIDIIVDADDSIMGDLDTNMRLQDDIEKLFPKCKYDMVWVGLLKESHDDLIRMFNELYLSGSIDSTEGIETPYINIMREAVWIEK